MSKDEKGEGHVLSDVKRKKFSNYFNLLDRNQDGRLERRDFEQIVQSVAAARGLQPESATYQDLESSVMATWSHIEQFVDRNGDGRASLDEWLRTLEDTIGNEQNYNRYVIPMAREIFNVLDTDDDGVVGVQEYQAFFQCLGASPQAAVGAFQRLDTNGDGQLARDELLERVREFHTGDDANAPGNWLFGAY